MTLYKQGFSDAILLMKAHFYNRIAETTSDDFYGRYCRAIDRLNIEWLKNLPIPEEPCEECGMKRPMKFNPEPLPLDDYARSGARVIRIGKGFPVVGKAIITTFKTGSGWAAPGVRGRLPDNDFHDGYWRLPVAIDD